MNDQNEPLAMELSPTPTPKIYGINNLPEHILGQIFNYLGQKEVPKLSLVCKQWKQAIDNYYEFKWKAVEYKDSDGNLIFKPFMKKCTKCTIYSSLTFPTFDDNFQFMKYPTYLKELSICAPLEPQYLQHIVSSLIKLEKLEFEGGANFPAVLSLAQTPGLAKLQNLKEIYCTPNECEMPGTGPKDAVSTFMDCKFPKLERFNLDLGCRTIAPSLLWKFAKTHESTLKYFWLYDSSSDPVNLNHSELEDFGAIKLQNLVEVFVVTNSWNPIWAKFISQASCLETLSFTLWSVSDESPQVPIPWIDFEAPIMNSSNTLEEVKLDNLSMMVGSRCRPLDLSVFRSCHQLRSLDLSGMEDVGQDAANPDEEILLMINANYLPTSLIKLRITDITMLSTDLLLTITKLENLESLNLFWVGKTGDFGVTSSVLQATSLLENLGTLCIEQFNTSDPEEDEALKTLIESIGVPFRGSGTELELWSNAHIRLSELQRG